METLGTNVDEIEKWLTINCGYKKSIAIRKIIGKYNLNKIDAYFIYYDWKRRFVAPGYDMKVFKAEGILSLSYEERIERIIETSKTTKGDEIRYILNKVKAGVTSKEIAAEMHKSRTKIDSVIARLREYEIIDKRR